MLLTHLPFVTHTFASGLLVKGHLDVADLICVVDTLNC